MPTSRSPKATGPHPVVIYLHGGGWSFGSPVSYREPRHAICPSGPPDDQPRLSAGARASVSGRTGGHGLRDPMGRPTMPADGTATAVALRLAAISSGANLAAGALISIAPELRSLVRAALLFYGVYDLRATAARTRSLAGLQKQLSSYVSDRDRSVRRSARKSAQGRGAGTAAAVFLIGAGTDTWCCPDSLALAEALSAAESPYELHVMEGMPHGFMQMSGLDGCRAAPGA